MQDAELLAAESNRPLWAENIQTHRSCSGGGDLLRALGQDGGVLCNSSEPAVGEGFVLKHGVLVGAACVASYTYNVRGNTHTRVCVTHSFPSGKTVVCFLLRRRGATSQSAVSSLSFAPKPPVNVRNERARQRRPGSGSIRCRLGQKH